MKSLTAAGWMPDLNGGPQNSASANLTSMLITKANKNTDIVQPVMIAFSMQMLMLRGLSD